MGLIIEKVWASPRAGVIWLHAYCCSTTACMGDCRPHYHQQHMAGQVLWVATGGPRKC